MRRTLVPLALVASLAACGPQVVNCPPGNYEDAAGVCQPGGNDDDAPIPTGDDDDDDPDADADGDGFTVGEGDCDDRNAAVNPGVDEVAANGRDDDCDRSVDEAEVALDDVWVDAGAPAAACADRITASAYGPVSPPKFVPVTVVRVGSSDGDDLPALAPVEAAIADANAALADAGLTLFVAASQVLYDSRYHTLARPVFPELRDEVPLDGTLHLYVVDEVLTAAKDPLEGIAAAPGDGGPPALVVSQRYLGAASLLHLLGHGFSLADTHAGTADGSDPEAVDGSNCGGAGDGLCDTPADPGPSWYNPDGCGVDPATCTLSGCGLDDEGDLYRPEVDDLMSAYPDACADLRFTDEQIQRIACAFDRDLPTIRLTDEPAIGPEIATVGARVDDDRAGRSLGDGDGLFEAGETVEWTVDVANLGAAPAVGVTAALIATDPRVTVVAADAAIGSLDVGAQEEAAFVLAAPMDCADDFELSIELRFSDADGGAWAESHRLPVDCTGIADVRAVSADAPSGARAGTNHDFTAEVRNNSPAALSGVEVAWYLSVDATVTAADTFVCRSVVPGSITANATKSHTARCVVPNLPDGSYTLGVIVDPDDALQEFDEANNTATDPTRFVLEPPPIADLWARNLTLARNEGFPGAAFDLDVRYDNLGSDAAEDFVFSILFSADATVTATDTFACQLSNPRDLAAGATDSFAVTGCVVPNLPIGEYTVGMWVDNTQVVAESDESNNIVADPIRFTVKGVDLTVSAVDVQLAQGRPQDPVDVVYIRENEGNADAGPFRLSIRWSTDATVDTSDAQGCFVDITSSPAGESRNPVLACTVPAGLAAGQYYVGVIIDAQGAVTEYNEANNVAVDPVRFTVQ